MCRRSWSTHHFFDPLHQQIFETAAKIIHAGKNATPITLRTFFERAEPISPNLTVPQYLGTLAANATTIINAEDYGRTVYDLATRRALIIIGEDMVTGAYDSPVDFTPQTQIQEAETRLGALSKAVPSALTAVPLSEFLELKIQAREWVLEDLLQQFALAMIYAWRGVGKTFLPWHSHTRSRPAVDF